MPYTITLTNGSFLTTIADATADTTTSLTLLGKNYPGYGTILADNFVRLLENAANTTAPSAPLAGQLWFDMNVPTTLKVWDGGAWAAIGLPADGRPITQSIIVEGSTADNVGFVMWDPIAPNNSRYYRIRVRDDSPYAGHWVLESLFNNLDGSMGGVETVILDTDSSGYIKLAATPGPTDNSTAIATTAFVKTAVSTLQSTLQGEIDTLTASIVPAGVIVMWSGAIGAVPAGWHICDGTSGTPNLRDRFIIGAGSTYTVGATGGATTASGSGTTSASGGGSFATNAGDALSLHTHVTDVQGAHSHGGVTDVWFLTLDEIPNHGHNIPVNAFLLADPSTGGTVWTGQAAGSGIFPVSEYRFDYQGGNNWHQHAISLDGSHAHNAVATGGTYHQHAFSLSNHTHTVSLTLSTMSPYYALAYIMKL